MGAERLRVVQGEDGDASSSPNQLTIEQLAHETGMSVRNIRAHQARGLLQPPEVRQRVGYYGPEHVARLRLIQELQADGFNLKGIERLLEGAHASSERLLHLKRAITAPFESEQPEVLTLEELQEMFGDQATPEALEKAVKLGLLVPMADDERFEAPSPSLIATAREVMGHGVPLLAALEVVERVQKRCGAVAQEFVELFLKWVWRPFEEAGHPEERWEQVVESIERLRPIASDVLVAIFKQTMTEYVDRAFGEELGRITGSGGRRR
ncbi:MAG TPA: MerR family transcriptional regulator [Solirubrobacterales bacterium]|jgi:DNA-binding transcriptional MerR regulator